MSTWKLQRSYGEWNDLPKVQLYGDNSGGVVLLPFAAKFDVHAANPLLAIKADIEKEVESNAGVVAASQVVTQHKARVATLNKRVISHDTRLVELDCQRKDEGLSELETSTLISTLSEIDSESAALKTAVAAVRPALEVAKQHAMAADAALQGAQTVAKANAVKVRLQAAEARRAKALNRLEAELSPALDEFAAADADLAALQSLVRTAPEPQPATAETISDNSLSRSTSKITRTPVPAGRNNDFARP